MRKPAEGAMAGEFIRYAVAAGMKIQLATFGLTNCDPRLCEFCNESGQSPAFLKFWDDTPLREALDRLGFNAVDLVEDARCFPDPEGAYELNRHTGRNPEIMIRLCKHRNFERWLRDVKRHLKDAIQRESSQGAPPTIKIAVYCRAGKHRSVAAALVLEFVLKQEGFECLETRHLSSRAWKSPNCRGLCDECKSTPKPLQDVLYETLDMWRGW